MSEVGRRAGDGKGSMRGGRERAEVGEIVEEDVRKARMRTRGGRGRVPKTTGGG